MPVEVVPAEVRPHHRVRQHLLAQRAFLRRDVVDVVEVGEVGRDGVGEDGLIMRTFLSACADDVGAEKLALWAAVREIDQFA